MLLIYRQKDTCDRTYAMINDNIWKCRHLKETITEQMTGNNDTQGDKLIYKREMKFALEKSDNSTYPYFNFVNSLSFAAAE